MSASDEVINRVADEAARKIKWLKLAESVQTEYEQSKNRRISTVLDAADEGVSVRDLADIAGISHQTIYTWRAMRKSKNDLDG